MGSTPTLYSYIFDTPDHPGIHGTVVRGACLDPDVASEWLAHPQYAADSRLRYLAERIAQHARAITVPEWGKWLQIWQTIRPGTSITFHLPETAQTLACTIDTNPGTFWSRFQTSRQRPITAKRVEEYRASVSLIASKAAVAYTPWYAWSIVADAWDMKSSSVLDRWTDVSALQCLRSAAFWAQSHQPDDRRHLYAWLTHDPLADSAALHTLWYAWESWSALHPVPTPWTFQYDVTHGEFHPTADAVDSIRQAPRVRCRIRARLNAGPPDDPKYLTIQDTWDNHAAFLADEATWHTLCLESIPWDTPSSLPTPETAPTPDSRPAPPSTPTAPSTHLPALVTDSAPPEKPGLETAPALDLTMLQTLCSQAEAFTEATLPSAYFSWLTAVSTAFPDPATQALWWEWFHQWPWPPVVLAAIARVRTGLAVAS